MSAGASNLLYCNRVSFHSIREQHSCPNQYRLGWVGINPNEFESENLRTRFFSLLTTDIQPISLSNVSKTMFRSRHYDWPVKVLLDSDWSIWGCFGKRFRWKDQTDAWLAVSTLIRHQQLSMPHLQHEVWDGNVSFRRKAGQEQTIKLNKSDFKKYVQSKTEVSYCHGPFTFIAKNIPGNFVCPKRVESNNLFSIIRW